MRMDSRDSFMTLAELYRRFHKPLRKWLERRCHFSGVDPDDVAHDVFMRLLKYPHTQKDANKAVYIFRIASNVASEYRERCVNKLWHASIDLLLLDGLNEHDGDEGSITSSPMDPDDALVTDQTPEIIIINDSLSAFVRATVAKMPERMRRVFFMAIYHDIPYAEIAKRLDLTYNQVFHDLEDARTLLRKRLK